MKLKTLGEDTKFQLEKYYEVYSEIDDKWYIMKVISVDHTSKILTKGVIGEKIYDFKINRYYESKHTINIVEDWYYTGPYDTLEEIEDYYPEYFI